MFANFYSFMGRAIDARPIMSINYYLIPISPLLANAGSSYSCPMKPITLSRQCEPNRQRERLPYEVNEPCLVIANASAA